MGYRENILGAVRTDRRHPIWNGVKMQAHHLLSKSGVRISGLKADLEHLGYDINVKENLVLLPCTLKGACHLKVQLHRGNHTATADIDILSGDDDDDADSYHGLSYHALVVTLLGDIRLDRNRGRLCMRRAATIQDELDELSETMLDAIKTFVIPLTSIHESFAPITRSGCCGEDATPAAARLLEAGQAPECPEGRDHRGREGISAAARIWNLRVGR
ncbi:AHH domain-containing protein [Rubrimonas cliftonensis]|uniref:A nuclease family of the HNH/ENDO VII superfamily with conserved AHH n=1 Tax=Rubrimonas cliftonensis TaxID=89524 RepID=A0A1H4G555_9RHOB|nr:AHH domain-containing protein [Rubrimonas cliftonensis]SEB04684.1 A nuclease family of the HNH/ENDO VII superfamily with conserved AHH [Rubrimonas cliftonensis]